MANEFLPFGTGGGANVMSQAAYGALAARLTGFVAGVAKSEELNKVWRQSAFVSAVLAQYITDHADDALDNGNVSTLLALLETAIRRQELNYVSAVGGSANVITATLAPVPANQAQLVGTPLRIRIATVNTGPVTLNVNGLGALAVVNNKGLALAAGDLIPDMVRDFMWDGTSYRLLSMVNSDLPFTGGATVYAGAGAGNFVVPATVTKIKIRAWAGGGGGGGALAVGAGAGGNGGAYAEGIYTVTPGQVIPYSVGAGGAGGPGGTVGSFGGNTTVGAITCGGGGAGGGGSGGSGGSTGSSGNAAGGTIQNVSGYTGQPGNVFSGSAAQGGAGGSSYSSGACFVPVATTGALNGTGGGAPGGGGSGAAGITGNSSGGTGGDGRIIIEY